MSELYVDSKDTLTDRDKTIFLFQFIRELNKLKQKAILNIKEYTWSFELRNLPNDPEYITLNYRDRVEEDANYDDNPQNNVILSVRKHEFQKCPEPDVILSEWLLPGWEVYKNNPQVREFIDLVPLEDDQESQREYFNDSDERIHIYEEWIVIRSEWVEKQKVIEQTRNLFTDLYRLYFELQRESETEEIIVANGTICDTENSLIQHPVITHRVNLEYNAQNDTVTIVDTNIQSELYSPVFQIMENVNLDSIKSLSEELQKNDYHPLDRNDTPEFLKVLVHQLHSESYYSDKPLEPGEKKNNRIILYLNPCFIVRKRIDGTIKAIERIIEDVQNDAPIPKHISEIVSGGLIDIPDDTEEPTIEERLASVGGESVDILLSKEANKEQLDIAKRIEMYNAVLVQGPPGTGKTHTIANLMGHFLAQGKSVLVTSYTKKALSVLKEKVADGLQSLCVSMLDDSNVDMERSVDGISKYMSKTTSFELKREMDSLAEERNDIIKRLASVRQKLYTIIKQECNCIVLNGDEISPTKAVEFINQNSDTLSYIPGNVRLFVPLPLTYEQLSELYMSNASISEDDELELATDLPNPACVMSPDIFIDTWNTIQHDLKEIHNIKDNKSWSVERNNSDIIIKGEFGELYFKSPNKNAITDLKQYAVSMGKIEPWMKSVAVDGKSSEAHRKRWSILIDEIEKTCLCADEFLSLSLGKTISIDENLPVDTVESAFKKMLPIFANKGKIDIFSFLFNKTFKPALSAVKINGSCPCSEEDCNLILKYIELNNDRKICANIWDELLSTKGTPKFSELSETEPENIAANWIKPIQNYLDWYNTYYETLLAKLSVVGIQAEILFKKDNMDSELVFTDKIMTCIEQIIPYLCDICLMTIESDECQASLDKQNALLKSGKRENSSICKKLIVAMNGGIISDYSELYANLEKMYEKYALQNSRNKSLQILESVAPGWVKAIRTRDGIHGKFTVPSDIEQAWKWKQLNGIIAEIIQKPFQELQAESLSLSKEYRRITAEYAEKSGWYHLLKRTESNINMTQALQGWKETVKDIGKGTGKQAPKLKAIAREKMAECQTAVPCWIMPINKALESLDPRYNKFDIVIIDEASQADVSSLAILYMGKKLIIVGDDRQVSPMAVGVEVNKIDSLQEQYIKDIIPNAHLYNAKTSIYDIAKTTFKPLMLKEHFRCVPEIIEFSNSLSYDGEIKPLRDASNSVLIPAVVNYRVSNGTREGKVNRNEAKMIVALMQACFEQPEYDGKTFGVISLLGDDQVKLIQSEIERNLNPHDIIERNILCGNSANFQGDERDVIFLSLVDSGTGEGPIHMLNFGPDDTYRKRYNVAVSRARDQLWVVDSLDSANDLKPGDIRKRLIDYSLNPKASEIKHSEIEQRADSPFEVSVATSLSDRGYHIEQQWNVGSYRIDIVAICGKKKVAIECDGERWHSGDEKIREDMERQTILERLGWRFIRIRGSEFYSDKEKTIERVISELKKFGIVPEDIEKHISSGRETELLNRVKARAYEIRNGYDANNSVPDMETIAVALNPTKIITEIQSKNPTTENINKSPKNKITKLASDTSKPVLTKLPNNGFIKELKEKNIEYIDNRMKADIIWIINNKDYQEIIINLIAKYNLNASFERRGSIATKNRPAWRVMYKG